MKHQEYIYYTKPELNYVEQAEDFIILLRNICQNSEITPMEAISFILAQNDVDSDVIEVST